MVRQLSQLYATRQSQATKKASMIKTTAGAGALRPNPATSTAEAPGPALGSTAVAVEPHAHVQGRLAVGPIEVGWDIIDERGC